MPLVRGTAGIGWTFVVGVLHAFDLRIALPLPSRIQPDVQAILCPSFDCFMASSVAPWLRAALRPADKHNDSADKNLRKVASPIKPLVRAALHPADKHNDAADEKSLNIGINNDVNTVAFDKATDGRIVADNVNGNSVDNNTSDDICNDAVVADNANDKSTDVSIVADNANGNWQREWLDAPPGFFDALSLPSIVSLWIRIC
jgi:hypothetical protein